MLVTFKLKRELVCHPFIETAHDSLAEGGRAGERVSNHPAFFSGAGEGRIAPAVVVVRGRGGDIRLLTKSGARWGHMAASREDTRGETREKVNRS